MFHLQMLSEGIYKVKVLSDTVSTYLLMALTANTTPVDVEGLLADNGAAKEGGALAPLNEQVKEWGGGMFTITRNAAIYIVGIAFLIAGCLMAFYSHNANKRDEAKSAVGWTFAAAILIFAAVSILVFAQKIGGALFSNPA